MHLETLYLHRNRAAFMQDLNYRVSRGYRYYISGQIAVEKLLPFISKMHDQHGVLFDKRTRSMLKQSVGAALFFAYPIGRSRDQPVELFDWFVLSSAALVGENSRYIDKHHGMPFRYYRLKEFSNKCVWFLSDEYMTKKRSTIQQIVQAGNVKKIYAFNTELLSCHMFSGVRSQIKSLNSELDKLCRKKNLSQIDLSKNIPYLGRVNFYDDSPIPLEDYVEGLKEELGRQAFEQSFKTNVTISEFDWGILSPAAETEQEAS